MTTTVIKADARRLPLPDGSIHAIICDPPYELGFMGKKWDSTGVAYDPATWREAYRVMKPGAHMLAFGGSRTWHRLAVAIEDAGFELRDSIAWLYGSGFPKSKSQLKPGFEPIVVARKPPAGTVAANVLAHGCGAINIDACRVDITEADLEALAVKDGNVTGLDDGRGIYGAGTRRPHGNPAGRWPPNVVLSHPPLVDGDGRVVGDACADGCVEGCPVAELDAQSGTSRSPGTYQRSTAVVNNVYGASNDRPTQYGHGDSGGASRFFPTFRYQAKAPAKERPRINGVAHSTVKPLGLMRHLVRLIVPPGGLLLDQFAGSGTTVEAALLEGFDVIGIDSDDDGHHIPMINHRISRSQAHARP